MSENREVMTLRALLGDYPNTLALKKGEVRSPRLVFEFADVKTPNHAFKRVVRELEFDVAELAIATYLTAKAYGKPLVLLPAVVLGKFQHESIVCSAARPLAPADLPGRRVGIRSHSATSWYRRYGAVPINHMVVVKASLHASKPWVAEEVFRVLAESKKAAGLPAKDGVDPFPFGVEPNRRSLELVIKYAEQQALIPRRYGVDELFDDVTRALGR